MSYDLYILSETAGFPRHTDRLEPVLSAALSAENTTFVPSDTQAGQVEMVENGIGDLGVPLTLGHMAPGAIFINIAFALDHHSALDRAIEQLNAFRTELGDTWFFYDPQYEVTADALDPRDIQAVFADMLPSEKRAPGLAGILGFPARRTPRQKWQDGLVFAMLALLIAYILIRD